MMNPIKDKERLARIKIDTDTIATLVTRDMLESDSPESVFMITMSEGITYIVLNKNLQDRKFEVYNCARGNQ